MWPAGRGRLPARVDPTARIPWRHRLSTQLLGVTAVLTVVVAGGVLALERGIREALLAQATSGAALFSETIVSATSSAMLEDRRPAAYATLADIGRQPGIVHLRMVAKTGRVTWSSERGETGRVVDRADPACATCHAPGRPLSHQPAEARSRIVAAGAHRFVELTTPVYNQTRCATAECHRHTRAEQVLGVIDVRVSLDDADRRIATFRAQTLGGTAVGLALFGGFLVWFARRRVVWPVGALLEGTRRVARDDLELEIHVDARGELGVLAASFNEMTRALRRVEGDLKHLNQELEAKVAERTAELERAYASMVQSEKLASLGQLAASIAHEINNPLAGILTFAKLLTRYAEHDVPDEARRRVMVKNLGLVERETERCSAIVRNLLDFARERPLLLKDVDVNRVVRESLHLIGHQLALQGHHIETRLAEVLPPVQADFGELRQAFVNLALNATEAMGRNGHLTIDTRSVDDGRGVEIAIADDGPGIPPEIRSRIFDPFFTTKDKGTGLGLSVVYGIVQRHAGKLDLASEAGQGTCFTIRLPVGPAPVQAGGERAAPAAAIAVRAPVADPPSGRSASGERSRAG